VLRRTRAGRRRVLCHETALGIPRRLAPEAHAVTLVAENERDLDRTRVDGERCLEIGSAARDLGEPSILHHDRPDRSGTVTVAIAESPVLLGIAQVVPVLLREREALVESAAQRAQPDDAAVQDGIRWRPGERRRARDDLLARLDLHAQAGARLSGAQQELPSRDQGVHHASGRRIACLGAAAGRGARRARCALTRLDAVADVVVVARSAVGENEMRTARQRIAAVERAGIGIPALQAGARGADTVLASFEAVADVAVGARRAVRQRRAMRALLVLAELDAVAGIVVLAQRSWRRHGAGRALSGLARLLAVAALAVAASRAVGPDRVLAADGVVARVVRTLVAVVAAGARAAPADPGRARLVAVARLAVAARGPVRRTLAGSADLVVTGLDPVADEAIAARAAFGGHRAGPADAALAGVGAVARVVVAAWRPVRGRRPGRANALLARLATVARVAVAASGTIRSEDPRHADAALAHVAVGAGVAGVAAAAVRRRCARLTDPALAGLRAVAGIAIAARRPVDDGSVLAAEQGIA